MALMFFLGYYTVVMTKVWQKWRPERSRRGMGCGVGHNSRRGGSAGPTGRRAHTALMVGENMLVYGGYQDLRGSSAELWSFNTPSETCVVVRIVKTVAINLLILPNIIKII
ncbi:hypothetical protein E2C01_070216 [Portunus trituberculatus]|uniref:Uncharacterized protein n=1 Tax=Portunus trituberculatus TaxID=210409 RepID=A0A5B7I1N5_PORTR|nr:hypothetical protein [Portunus trituberculatus]